MILRPAIAYAKLGDTTDSFRCVLPVGLALTLLIRRVPYQITRELSGAVNSLCALFIAPFGLVRDEGIEEYIGLQAYCSNR